MELNAAELIYKYKTTKDEVYLQNIIGAFHPLIRKYARKFDREDEEDMQQELTIAVVEAVQHIQVYERDGECVNYIKQAVLNRFRELIRKTLVKKEMESPTEIMPEINEEDPYSLLEYTYVVEGVLSQLPEKKKQIVRWILYDGLSVADVAERMRLPRQYIYKVYRQCVEEIQKVIME